MSHYYCDPTTTDTSAAARNRFESIPNNNNNNNNGCCCCCTECQIQARVKKLQDALSRQENETRIVTTRLRETERAFRKTGKALNDTESALRQLQITYNMQQQNMAILQQIASDRDRDLQKQNRLVHVLQTQIKSIWMKQQQQQHR